jgi:HD-like signal output (HDOD) protein
MSSSTAAGKTLPPELQQALARVTEINSLPEITARIVEAVENPRATAHEMHEIVCSDPALAAKILKVVNSAFYGLPSLIASLDRAILLLGLSAVKNIALAASLSRLFNAEAVSEEFTARDLWRHSVAVGVCARLLAGGGGGLQAEEAFVAGLVHDVGLIVAQQVYPERLKVVADQCYDEPQSFCALEDSLIGADHQALGGALAARWKFPPALQYAIAYHHDPTSVPPEFQRISTVMYAADTLCSRAHYGFWLTAQTQEIPDSLLRPVGLVPQHLEQVIEQLPKQVEEAERIFAE